MNVKRFTARTSRDALTLVRQALGDDAVVLSTKPCAEGVEVVAMAPGSLQQLEQSAVAAVPPTPASASRKLLARNKPAADDSSDPGRASEVGDDVQRLSMSTLSFQDYVRERMLRRRQAAMRREEPTDEPVEMTPPMQQDLRAAEPKPALRSAADRAADRAAANAAEARRAQLEAEARHDEDYAPEPRRAEPQRQQAAREQLAARHELPIAQPAPRREPPVLRDEVRSVERTVERRSPANAAARALELAGARAVDLGLSSPESINHGARRDQQDMMNELRSMKGLIEERFGALAFMEKLQRQPAHARLTQKLLDCGFSPMLIRKLADGLGNEITDEATWAASVLERNLLTGENDVALEDQGGVLAMIGSTGVGKTTSTAKIAAAFATRHGASNLGLITLDAYRVGAHEQLRAYGRILGVPVYTAHDRATLEDLLDLLSAKKMVLIDTAGIAQRDSRTAELLDMLGHRSIEKLLVVNAASQGETIDDVLMAYRASTARGVVLSKMDEAVKLGPALDAVIRHKLKVVGVANGQRVPEDWHRLSAQALVQRALRSGGSSVYRMDASDVSLVFAAAQVPGQVGLHGQHVATQAAQNPLA
ncbi:hypothetical protein BH09PSE5_BH09PSE5_49130 [soil metagenome]